MKSFKIAVLAGDGIGPEIMTEALKVLKVIEARNDVSFELMPAAFGANAYFECGHPFPQATIDISDAADAILKGPIGLSHEESQKIPVDMLPERAAISARYHCPKHWPTFHLSSQKSSGKASI